MLQVHESPLFCTTWRNGVLDMTVPYDRWAAFDTGAAKVGRDKSFTQLFASHAVRLRKVSARP